MAYYIRIKGHETPVFLGYVLPQMDIRRAIREGAARALVPALPQDRFRHYYWVLYSPGRPLAIADEIMCDLANGGQFNDRRIYQVNPQFYEISEQ